jgi:hypothetical protein
MNGYRADKSTNLALAGIHCLLLWLIVGDLNT